MCHLTPHSQCYSQQYSFNVPKNAQIFLTVKLVIYYIYNIIRYYITYLTQLVADDTFILDIAKDYSLLEQCTELLWLLTRILYLHIIITP